MPSPARPDAGADPAAQPRAEVGAEPRAVARAEPGTQLGAVARPEINAEARAPRRGATAWPIWAWLGGVLLVGLVVRLPLLGIDPGIYDAAYFRSLMQAAAGNIGDVYAAVSPDYPPLTVLVFGLAGRLAAGLDPVVAAKLPEVAASLALAGLIGGVVYWRTAAVGLAALAAAAYALNPGVVYVSAYWTQAEALWVLPVALSLLALERRRFVLAWLALAAAVLTKPQAAAFLPLLLVATPWRTWLRGLAAALGLAVVASAPWLLSGRGQDVAQVYLGLSGADNWVSGSAYSLWYLLLLGRTHQVPADSAFLGPLTYQQVGAVLFVGLVIWVVWHAQPRGAALPGSRRLAPPGVSVDVCAATLWLGLAVLLTQTHERYIHPVLPLLLLAPEMLRERRLWLVWTGVSLAYAYNLITVLPFDGFPGPSLIAEPGGGMRVMLLRGLSLVAAATFLMSLGLLAARLRTWASAR